MANRELSELYDESSAALARIHGWACERVYLPDLAGTTNGARPDRVTLYDPHNPTGVQRASAPTPRPQSARPRLAPVSVAKLVRPAGGRYLWSECVHEAAHVVAAHVCGLEVYRAMVANNACAVYERSTDTYTRAVCTLAGPVAEALLTESSDFEAAAKNDLTALIELGLSDADENAAWADAEQIVTERRVAIDSVAMKLSFWGCVSGADVAKACDQT